MRFSAAIQPRQPLRSPVAAEFIKRLLAAKPVERPVPPPTRVEELPLDLDQRVRLIGEW